MNSNATQDLKWKREPGHSQEKVQTHFVEVMIGGKAYKLKLGSGQEASYLKELGHFVDTKVLEFKELFPSAAHDTLLMITLLNLAETILTKKELVSPILGSSEPFKRESQPHDRATPHPPDAALAQFLTDKLETLQTKLQTALNPSSEEVL